MHINDAVDASIMLMSIDKKNISINTPYNISSFETSPSKWRDTINSLGYELKIDYEVDFRQDIADSWPKKVDDSLLRKDIDWIPKFNEKETALDSSNQFNFKLKSVDISVIGNQSSSSSQ